MGNSNSLEKPRFVVLYHEMPAGDDRPSHWDLMLEVDCRLETWALEYKPVAGKKIVAQKLTSHRINYLTYEGLVSNRRGSVTRVMEGHFAGDGPADSSQHEFQIVLFESGGTKMLVNFVQENDQAWHIDFIDPSIA